MTLRDLATAVLILALIGIVLCCVILAFTAAARWALGRESARVAAETFERDYIPTVDEVADQDVPAMLEEIEALLDDSMAHVKRLGRAAS